MTAEQGVKNIKGELHVNAGIIIQKLWRGKLKFFFSFLQWNDRCNGRRTLNLMLSLGEMLPDMTSDS